MADTPAWLSEYPEVQDDSWLNQYKEVGETPFLDLSETASSLGRAVTSLPTTTMASLSQAWEGLENPWKRSEGYLSRRQEMQALQDELAASEAEAAASGDASTVSSAIREATPSLGFSGATLLPSLGAGAGTLALSKSPAAARGAAAATSALMAYRMAGAQFLDDAKERIDTYFQENVGRAPSEQEQEEAYQELLPLARKFGAAEAGPEALGNLALGGAGKYIRRALGGKGGIVDLASNALGKVTGTKAALAGAGALASEVGTEAVTGVEQSRIQKQFEEGIMRGESPESVALAERSLGDYTSAIEEVAPATIATVGMMGAAGLGPKAISRGIQALRRPKTQAEQPAEEQPSMPLPDEIVIAEENLKATENAPFTNVSGQAAAAIIEQNNQIASQPTIQPVVDKNAPPTLSKVEAINKTKADLDERAKALGYDNARQLNLALQTQSTLSDEQSQVLEGYSLLNQEVKALSWEDASDLSDGDFSTWVKPRFPAENPKMEEELRDAADLQRALTKRGDTQKAEQIQEKIKNAKRKQDWTLDSWNTRFPDEPRTQEEIDAINAENAAWNAEVDAILESFETSEPTIQPEQAAEKVGAEVTPLSEGAERNRAIIAEAAAKLRGEAPQDISAGLRATIPPSLPEAGSQPVVDKEAPAVTTVRAAPIESIELPTDSSDAIKGIVKRHDSLFKNLRNAGVDVRLSRPSEAAETKGVFWVNETDEGKLELVLDEKNAEKTEAVGLTDQAIFHETVHAAQALFDRDNQFLSTQADKVFDPNSSEFDQELDSFMANEVPSWSKIRGTRNAKYEAVRALLEAKHLNKTSRSFRPGMPFVRYLSQFIEWAKANVFSFGTAKNKKFSLYVTKIDRLLNSILSAAPIQPEPIETQEDAVQEQIPDEGVLRQERPEMELQGVGEGNVQPEEVAETSAIKQKPIKIGGTSPRAQSAAQEIRSLVGDETELRGQVVTAQGVRVKLLPFGESVRVSEIEVPSDLRGQGLASEALEQITSEADRLGVPLTLSAEPFGQKGLSKKDLESWYARKGFVPSGKQGILVREPQQPPSPTTGTEPTTATEGMVTPGGVATERDLTKSEQMTPEEIKSGVSSSAKNMDERWEKLKSTPAPDGWRLRDNPPMAVETGDGRFYVLKQSGKYKSYDSKEEALAIRTKGLERSFKERRLNALADHNIAIIKAAKSNLPVSSAAVDTYGIKLPEGYVKQGDLYVFQPQTTAAETQIQPIVSENAVNDGKGVTSVSKNKIIRFVESYPTKGGVMAPSSYVAEDRTDRRQTKSKNFQTRKEAEGWLRSGDKEKTTVGVFPENQPIKVSRTRVFREPILDADGKTVGYEDVVRSKETTITVVRQTPSYIWTSNGEQWAKNTIQLLSPQTKQAAEKQTPVPLREGTGAAGVVQSEPVEGSIPTDEKVSPETESESSGNLSTVEQIDRLVQSGAKPEEMDKFVKSLTDEQFNELVASEAFDVDPKLAIKPNDTYDAKRIKRRKFVDAVNASTKEVRKTAQQVFQEEEASAKKQEKLEQDTKSSLNSVVGPQKKNDIQGTVTKADVEVARAALTNSGEIPNAYLTNVYESREAFLADRMNSRLFPASYVRLQTEKNIEGLFENGQTLVFAKEVQVSDLDRGLAKMLGVSDEQAAARRVIAHENGHKAISLFTMAEKRELRGYLMRAYSDEQVENLVKTYTEYADWRTNPESRLEALEELLMRDFEKMERIPTGGVWDDIVQFLKRVWRRLTGQKGEPTLKNLKDVVRLMRNAMKRPEVPLGSFRLKDGGEVKLSMIAPTAGITPEMDAEYLAAVEAGDMDAAQRMVDEAAKAAMPKSVAIEPMLSSKEKASDKPLLKLFHGTDANFNVFERGRKGITDFGFLGIIDTERHGIFFAENKKFAETFAKSKGGRRVVQAFLNVTNPFSLQDAEDILYARDIGGEFTEDTQMARWFKSLPDQWEAFDGENGITFTNWLSSKGYDGAIIQETGVGLDGEPTQDVWVALSPNQIKSADPVTRDESGNVIPLSQRFQTTSPDIRFSRPQFSSETSAAFTAGSEAARSALYSERDMDIREAIRRAYEAMPKTNSVAVPIGELFAKTEELMPGVTQDEFSLVLQDMFEDNGAVLQEGEVVEPLTEQDRRYLALAEDEDANREELQRMVDEAAKDAGYDSPKVYHGTKSGRWTKFRKKTKNSFSGIEGYYFSPIKDVAKSYADAAMEESGRSGNGRVISAYLKNPTFLPDEEGGGSPYAMYGGEYVVAEPSQIKSADPVTRDDQGRIIPLSRRFDTGADIRGQINVTAPEGRRAGFVVVMPRAAKASRIKAEDATDAAKTFQADIIEAGKGRIDTASYQGNALKSTEAPDHNVNAPELYKDAAISLVDSLLKKNSITDIADSFQDPEFRVAVGLLGNKAINPNVAQQAELFTGAVIQKKLEKALNDESDPAKKRLIEKTLKNHKAYYTTATGIGQNLNAVGALQQDPDFKGMFLFNEAEKEMADKAKDKLDTITGGGTQPVTDMVNQSEEAAADEATKEMTGDAEEDQDAIDLAAGEETLDERLKKLYEELKDWLRTKGAIVRARAARKSANAAKASLSKEQRDAIMRMSDEELDALEKKADENIERILNAILGKESDAKTPEQKKTRQKRKKMVDTAKKRAEAGKSIDISDTESVVKIVLREMGKARPGKQVPLTKLMPWKDILAQKAKTVEEYRQRILDAMMASDAFKEVSDEDKAKIADVFAKQWDKKRTDILDRMLEREIERKRREGSLSEAAAKALQKSRNKIIELANLGGFDNDDLMKVLGEKFGIKTGFSEAEKARISELADKLQDETLNPAKRNKLAMEFAVTLAGASEIPVAEIIANWWTSSVLFGPQTIFSIGAAFVNGAYSITTIGTRRMLADLTRGDVKGAIEESILMLQGIAKYLGAFKQAGRRAWSYLWTGNVDVLGAAANDILGEINSLEELKRFKRHKLLAENLAKDPRALRRYVGMYLRFVNRLLTSLDAFNVMVTKAGTASLALRMSGMSTDNIIKAEKMLNLKAYKDQVIRDYFDNKAPTTQDGKALVDSYAEAEMYRAVDQLGGKMENADYLASESAMTMNPTGLGGFFYRSITGLDSRMKKAAEDYLEKAKKDWTTEKDLESALFLGLAYLRQFAVQNLGGVAGYKFIRFASNKFNQGISYLPMVGLLRTLEAKGDEIKGKEAFIETIHRNQVIGAVLTLAAIAVVKALEEEPDDDKRGNFWNGGWQNLTPDQKKQMLAKGQKEYTMGFKFNGRWYVFNYQNWPLNQVLAAIGSMSDQIRFSPKQWKEKGALSKPLAGIVSGLKSTLEIPALSQLGELAGNRLASKDPTEQTVDRLSRVAAGWVGGFVPRILKDLDFATQPETRKYKTLWEKTASHIPIYRRYVGEDYYDILGQPIKRNVIPGSREFMMGPTEPEYKILGALNSRNIFLTPANAEYRMVGKGRNRRRLTQEEADAYSLETGKGYRQMLLRYGQRALQMPTERARAFLSDKADEVRDRALKKVYRGYKS